MHITRRSFLRRTAGAAAVAALVSRRGWPETTAPGLRLSACDWSLGAGGPGGLLIAKQVGLEGLEVSAGDPADVLQIADVAFRQQYKEQMTSTGIVVSSVAMGLLNSAPLATEPRGPAWLEQTIDATKDLGAKVMLLAFFGEGDLRERRALKTADVDAVVQRLKDAAPRAEAAGVMLGIENTLSGKDNLAILDRVQSDAVRVYYDIGNSTSNRYDVPAEIRELGDRICQIHFKDGRYYLGEGKVKMEPVAEAMHAIGYAGWVVLETDVPSKDRDVDFKRNADYVRKLLDIS